MISTQAKTLYSLSNKIGFSLNLFLKFKSRRELLAT